MAVDSHIALEMSRRLKQLRPDCKVILGGSHFSAIAEDVRRLYPWVDTVFQGEAEQAFAGFLNPKVQLDNEPLQYSLDLLGELHLPAYFHVNPRRIINLETGRGCRFRCAFCYSPGHYGSVRNFSIGQVLQQMSDFPKVGVRHVWFVEDNFLNDPIRAKNLCRELEELRGRCTWSCYATFPQLSEDVIEGMARAGCTEVFCGIDAVGSVAERAFQKAFLRGSNPITTKVRCLTSAGIKPTFAFLVAPPSHEAGAGYADTVDAALESQSAGARTLLNPLSLYSGTIAYRRAALRLEPDSLQAQMMMDLPEMAVHNPFAQDHPELFPFHSRFVDEAEWRLFLAKARCAATLIDCYPRTLTALQEEERIPVTEVVWRTLQQFENWSEVSRETVREVERDVGYLVLEGLATDSGVREVLKAEYQPQKELLPVADGSKMEM
jgi:hypothetical protein